MNPKSQSISSTQLVRSLPKVKEMLVPGPVHVTTHGREDFVILSSRQYHDMRSLVGMDVDRLDTKLRLTFETIDELVLILDTNLNIRRINQAFCDVLDIEPDNAIGAPIENLVETPNDQYILLRLKEALESKRPESFELPAGHRGNRNYHYKIVPWPNGVAMFSKDITNRSRIRNATVERAAFEACLAKVESVGTGVLNQAGKLTSVSPSFASLVGGTASALSGLSIYSMIDEPSAKKIRALLSGPHKVPQEIDIRYLCKGTAFKPAKMVLTQFQTIENMLNFAFVIHDKPPTGFCQENATASGEKQY